MARLWYWNVVHLLQHCGVVILVLAGPHAQEMGKEEGVANMSWRLLMCTYDIDVISTTESF